MSKEQLKLPLELARDLADMEGPYDLQLEGETWAGPVTAVVENRHTGEETRWTSIHELVVKTADGRLWRRLYEQGLTEYQDTRPFEYEGSVIPFDECRRKVVEVCEYTPV